MSATNRIRELYSALANLRTPGEYQRFFEDLCTPSEIAAMADRWCVARLLKKDISYRKINEMTGVSTATITRVARCLNYGSGGYQQLLADNRKGENP